jgi:transposase
LRGRRVITANAPAKHWRGKLKHNHDAILTSWATGGSVTQIAESIGIHRGTVSNIILRVRDRGDSRAVAKPRGRRPKR